MCSWSGSHIRWGQAFRLRHLSTGHYLALAEDRGLVLQDRDKSDTSATAFCFRPSKVSAPFVALYMNIFDTVLLLQLGVKNLQSKEVRPF